MDSSSNRIEWLDVAKGIAIILVVLGHSALPAFANRFIFAFHMPFFFFASGYSSNFNKYSFGNYVGKKAKALLLPFIIYSLCNLVLQPYVSDMTYSEYWIRFVKEGWMGVPLWFVPVLFLALLLAWCFFRIKKRWSQVILIVVFPLISVLLNINDICIPWNMAVVPYASFLIILGNIGGRLFMKDSIDKNSSMKYKLSLMVLCLCVTGSISYFWKLDMCWNTILPFFPLLMGAIAGSVFLSLLAMLIVRYSQPIKYMLSRIGKETFLILAFAEVSIVYLNYFFSLNYVLKYVLLVIILYVLYLSKLLMVKLLKKD